MFNLNPPCFWVIRQLFPFCHKMFYLNEGASSVEATLDMEVGSNIHSDVLSSDAPELANTIVLHTDTNQGASSAGKLLYCYEGQMARSLYLLENLTVIC